MSETGSSLGSDVALGDMPIGVQHFIKAGCHFGHQTKRWNPKMRPFIYGARNGIHIIDLDQTAQLFKRAYNFIVEAVGRGGHVLFVGTKRQAQDIIQEEAARSGQFYVNDRWLGGTLTNFRTIKIGIERLRLLERMIEDGTMEALPKKEALMLDRERQKLDKFLGGIKAHERRAGRHLRGRPAPRAHRGSRGAAPQHPDRRHHGHQLRSGSHRLRHPGERRRHPLGQAHHLAHRRRLRRGHAASS